MVIWHSGHLIFLAACWSWGAIGHGWRFPFCSLVIGLLSGLLSGKKGLRILIGTIELLVFCIVFRIFNRCFKVFAIICNGCFIFWTYLIRHIFGHPGNRTQFLRNVAFPGFYRRYCLGVGPFCNFRVQFPLGIWTFASRNVNIPNVFDALISQNASPPT